MSIAWPSYLPIPRRSGISYQAADLVARSEMNGGPSRSRQMFTAGPTQYNVTFVVTPSSWAMFQAFFDYELSRGAAEFTLPIESGNGVESKRVKFVGVPSYDGSLGAGNALISAVIEVQEQVGFDQNTYVVIRDLYTGNPFTYSDFIDAMEQHVNTDLPNSTMGV